MTHRCRDTRWTHQGKHSALAIERQRRQQTNTLLERERDRDRQTERHTQRERESVCVCVREREREMRYTILGAPALDPLIDEQQHHQNNAGREDLHIPNTHTSTRHA